MGNSALFIQTRQLILKTALTADKLCYSDEFIEEFRHFEVHLVGEARYEQNYTLLFVQGGIAAFGAGAARGAELGSEQLCVFSTNRI